ncbi:MAG: amidase family protein, partial [Pseudomonadota bacterium]
ILLKDNIEAKGMATTAGSLALVSNLAADDAPLVRSLRRAGATILGKTNLSEWANFRSEFSSSGWSGVGGQTRNAIDTTRSPCGSSSGSAVAVAVGYVDIAIGTETSGSIVCPASVNGVVGFKPTHGLVSGDGIVPLARTQDTAGPITLTVAQAATTLAYMLAEDHAQHREVHSGLLSLDAVSTLAGARIGIYSPSMGFDPRRDRALGRVLDTLKEHDVTLIDDLSISPYPSYQKDSYSVLLYEFSRDLKSYFQRLDNPSRTLDLPALIRFNELNAAQELAYFDQSIFIKAAELPDTHEDYERKRAATKRAMSVDGLDRLFADHQLDALIGITTGPAWKIDWVNGDAFFGPSMAGPAAVAGNPHITLPLAEVDGLPLGISLIGQRLEDHRLAALAKLVSDAHGTIDWRSRIKSARKARSD